MPVKVPRDCPMQFVDYNPSMAGTDSFGRRRLRFTCRRISKKWWRGLYYFVIDTSLCNGYVVYCFFFKRCGCAGKPMKFAQFIQRVYEDGFKELGYNLKLVKLSRSSNKHVVVNDDDDLIDLSGGVSGGAAAASASASGTSTKCSGVDPCLLSEVGRYKASTRYTNCVWCYGPNPDTTDKCSQLTKYYCLGCASPLCLRCFKPWHNYLKDK